MQLLPLLSGAISLIGTVPYFLDTLKGTTKPRVASWLVWGVLTGIAAAASYSVGQVSAAVLASCMTFSCFLVTATALWRERRAAFSRFDFACLSASAVGIILWKCFNSPEIAIVAVVAVDAVASLPTVRHAYQAPEEETLFEFLMAGLASVVTLIGATSITLAAVAYPLYIIAFDFTVAFLIIRGRFRGYGGERL